MNRFFVDPAAIKGEQVIITGEDVAHISRVLRLREGDTIALCDGACNEYVAAITATEKEQVTAKILSSGRSQTEPLTRVILYQGLPKAGKMETIIQKCVELGISDIVPVYTERCVVKPEEGSDKKQLRYQRVAYEAAKQSRRGIVPVVHKTVKLKNCDFSCCDAVLFAYEEEQEVTLKQALKTVKRGDTVGLIVGPEGGFSPEEASWLRGRVAGTVTLGKRILRTETAGMAMLAMALYELEE